MAHRIRQQADSHRFYVYSTISVLNPATQSTLWLLIFIPQQARHHKMRLGCRLNAGGAQWAERHGCRESAVRTWMSVRRGPTERRRSEGTRRSRAQPGVQTLGYLVSFQVTRRRRNSLAVRTNQTISATLSSGNAHHTSQLAAECGGPSTSMVTDTPPSRKSPTGFASAQNSRARRAVTAVSTRNIRSPNCTGFMPDALSRSTS